MSIKIAVPVFVITMVLTIVAILGAAILQWTNLVYGAVLGVFLLCTEIVGNYYGTQKNRGIATKIVLCIFLLFCMALTIAAVYTGLILRFPIEQNTYIAPSIIVDALLTIVSVGLLTWNADTAHWGDS